jgi:hypothetical protein
MYMAKKLKTISKENANKPFHGVKNFKIRIWTILIFGKSIYTL